MKKRRFSWVAGVVAMASCLLGLACGDIVVPTEDAAPSTDVDAAIASDTTVAPLPTCPAYCAEALQFCPVGTKHQIYPNPSTCNSTCERWAGWPKGTKDQSNYDTNTVGCRMVHLEAAAADQGTHCPHASPSGGNQCGTWCDNYCSLALRNCGSVGLYADDQACRTACAQIKTTGGPSDITGDSVQCRIHFLVLAGSEPGNAEQVKIYCSNGGFSGGDECK